MCFDGMNKICTAVVNITQHLEFSSGLQCERHRAHVECEFVSHYKITKSFYVFILQDPGLARLQEVKQTIRIHCGDFFFLHKIL